MHCSQRIIIKDIHRLTPTGGSLKYAIFDDRILFFAFALCSVPKLALKYFNVNPFLQVNKNSHFFQVFQRYMYACGIFFLVKTKYFYHRLSRRSCHLFLSSSDRDLCQKYCGKYQPASCKLSYPIRSPRMIQPAMTENTDSRLMIIEATVGFSPFCPTI